MAKPKKTKAPADVLDLAEKLMDIRKKKHELEAVDKALATELKKRIKAGESQDLFKLSTSQGLEVLDASQAILWAQATAPHALTVDTKIAKAILGTYDTLPAGFGVKVTEKLVQTEQEVEE